MAAAVAEPRPFAHEGSDLAVDPTIVWGRLDNGLRYVLRPMPNQDRVSLRLLIEAGSLNEGEDERGLAHVLEHMAFKGSESMSPGARDAELQRLGMAFGVHNNATTTFDSTWYRLDLPNGEDAVIDRALFVLRETAGRLTIPADELQRERGVIEAEMRVRDDANFRAWKAANAMIFGDWLVRRMPIGVPEVVRQARREDVERFYRHWYRPDRMVVIAAGGFDPQALVGRIRAHFDDLESIGSNTLDPPPPLVPRQPMFRLLAEPAGDLTVTVLTAEPLDRFRDGLAVRERRLKIGMAQGILVRRLSARGADGTFSTPTVATSTAFNRAWTGSIDLKTTLLHWREAVAAVEQELRRTLAHGFTANEVAEAKASVRKSLQQTRANQAAAKPPAAADQLLFAVRYDIVSNDVAPVVDHMERLVESLDGRDLQASLATLWSEADRRWLIRGPLNDEIDEAAVESTLQASEAVVLAPPEAKQELAFAYSPGGEPGRIVAREETLGSLSIATFANGARAVLFASRSSSQRAHVAIDLFAGGEARQPPGQPGLAFLAGSRLLDGGLLAHPIEEIGRLLDGRNIRLNFQVSQTQFQFTINAPVDELDFALRVVTAYLDAPGFREQAFARAQADLDRVVARTAASSQGVIANYLPGRRCAGDWRCGMPDLAVLKQRRWEEVKAWLGPALKDAPLVVTVVGPINRDTALKHIAETIGALPTRQPVPSGWIPEVELPTIAAGSAETLAVAGTDQLAYAIVEWPVANRRDYERWIRQDLVARLLNERLRVSLRGQDGEAYAPLVRQLGGENVRPSWMRAQVDAKPDTARDIARRIVAIAGEIATVPFTAEELSRAKAPALNQFRERLGDDDSRLGAIRAVSDPSSAMAHFERAPYVVGESTLEELNALAREVLSPETARVYLVAPQAATHRP